jgi:preprotein translocase subunit SecE
LGVQVPPRLPISKLLVVENMATESTSWMKGMTDYVTGVRSEVSKITWPPQDEAIAGTIGVVVIVTIVVTVLGLIDFGLSRVMQVILQ